MISDIKHTALVEGRAGDVLTLSMVVCGACNTCGARTLCNLDEGQLRILTVEVPDAQAFEVGERVELCISRTMSVKAVFLAYIIPFLIGFSLLFVLLQVGCSDVVAGLSSLGSLVVYYIVLYAMRRRIEHGITFTVHKIGA